MTVTVYDALGFFYVVLALFFPVFWWSACFIWAAFRWYKDGPLDEGVSLEEPAQIEMEEIYKKAA